MPRSCSRRSARPTAGARRRSAPGGAPSTSALGWWPGDPRYPKAAFYAYAHPAPEGFADATLQPAAARWDDALGEFVLDWEDVVAAPDPHAAAVAFGRSAVQHACRICKWDPELAASAEGNPPPIG